MCNDALAVLTLEGDLTTPPTPLAPFNPDTDPGNTERMAALWAALTRPFDESELELKPQAVTKTDRPVYDMCTAQRPGRDGVACGKRHVTPAIHLTYVGHAGLTMRLLEVDRGWTWRPVARNARPDHITAALASGNPEMLRILFENSEPLIGAEGMWIELSILGRTVYGFGDAQGKRGANAVKEMIGDALRNAAMRLGVATYLWSKSAAAEALADPAPGSTRTDNTPPAEDHPAEVVNRVARQERARREPAEQASREHARRGRSTHPPHPDPVVSARTSIVRWASNLRPPITPEDLDVAYIAEYGYSIGAETNPTNLLAFHADQQREVKIQRGQS